MVNALRRLDQEALVRAQQLNGAGTPMAVRPILRETPSFLAGNHGLGVGILEQHSGRVIGVGDLESPHARRCDGSPEASQEPGDAARSVPCAAARVSAAQRTRNGIVPALTRRSALVAIADRPVFPALRHRSSMFSGILAREALARRVRGMGRSAGHSLSLWAENQGKTPDRSGRTVQWVHTSVSGGAR